MGSPISPSQRQVEIPGSSTYLPPAASSEFSSSAGEREFDRLSRSQVQQLQILIQDFNRDINASSPGRDSAGFDSARITELHGRIAELTTRGHTNSNSISQAGLPPPAYEANPQQLGYLGQAKGTIRF